MARIAALQPVSLRPPFSRIRNTTLFKLVLPGVFRWQLLEGVRVPRYGCWRYVMQIAALPCKLNKAVHVWPPRRVPFLGVAPRKLLIRGEMAEWLKAHAWKACIPQGIQGSNPCLSAIALDNQALASNKRLGTVHTSSCNSHLSFLFSVYLTKKNRPSWLGIERNAA
jgi:hypothetical protein